jgi:hypothetical protein
MFKNDASPYFEYADLHIAHAKKLSFKTFSNSLHTQIHCQEFRIFPEHSTLLAVCS